MEQKLRENIEINIITIASIVFFANIGLTFLILIPNRLLPERYQPKNIDLQDLEDQYK